MEELKNYKIYACSRWLYKRSFHFYIAENDVRLGKSRFWRTLLASRLTLVFFAFFKSKSVMN
ncbi:hypothetical protein OCD93_01720 [Bacillus toyonensis]|nr:hypothetical protein [Bacillus toyonensis]